MKCILCAKEFSKENATWISENHAICPDCAANTSKQEEADYEYVGENNKTGVMIQSVAKIIWILNVIAALIAFLFSGVSSISLIIAYLFAVFVTGLMIYGLGEIIILLGQINSKIPKRKK